MDAPRAAVAALLVLAAALPVARRLRRRLRVRRGAARVARHADRDRAAGARRPTASCAGTCATTPATALRIEASKVRVYDDRGRRLKASATFAAGYLHSLYPPTRGPASLPDSELERLGKIAKIEPGKTAQMTVSWREPGGRRTAARIDYGPGSLQIPPEAVDRRRTAELLATASDPAGRAPRPPAPPERASAHPGAGTAGKRGCARSSGATPSASAISPIVCPPARSARSARSASSVLRGRRRSAALPVEQQPQQQRADVVIARRRGEAGRAQVLRRIAFRDEARHARGQAVQHDVGIRLTRHEDDACVQPLGRRRARGRDVGQPALAEHDHVGRYPAPPPAAGGPARSGPGRARAPAPVPAAGSPARRPARLAAARPWRHPCPWPIANHTVATRVQSNERRPWPVKLQRPGAGVDQ